MRPRTAILLFLGALCALRLMLVGQIELTPDEAYYHLWSQRLDWAYYSKGPGVATVIKAGTALFGPTEFGVRFFSPLLALASSVLIFSLAKRLYGEEVAAWATLALNLAPIFQAGGLLMTIDPLSIFFWSAALCTLWRALERSPRFSWHWPLTGLLVGLGFLCKYTNAIQLLSVAMILAMSRRHRSDFLRPGFWLMLAVFAVCTLPPIIWNARHDWVTASHLQTRGGLTGGWAFHPGEFLAYLGMHFGVYSPALFAILLFGLWHGLRRWRSNFKTLFLIAFALPLIALYFFLSIKQTGEANWTAPAFVSLGVYAAKVWLDLALAKRWARTVAAIGMVLGLAMSIVLPNTDIARAAGIPWRYDLDPSYRLRGWRSSAEFVDAFRKQFEAETGEKTFLIANRYGTAAALAFSLPEKRAEYPGHPPIYIPESQHIECQFSFWPRYDEFVPLDQVPPAAIDENFTEQQGVNLFVGRTALYVTDQIQEKPPTTLKGGFERFELVKLARLSRRGEPLREIRIFACYNYRGVEL